MIVSASTMYTFPARLRRGVEGEGEDFEETGAGWVVRGKGAGGDSCEAAVRDKSPALATADVLGERLAGKRQI